MKFPEPTTERIEKLKRVVPKGTIKVEELPAFDGRELEPSGYADLGLESSEDQGESQREAA